MKLKVEPGKPLTFFVRIKGPNGIRELKAVLDTGCEYCIVPLQDARQLGYEAYFNPADPGLGTLAITTTDILEVDEIELDEVSVGDLTARKVKALAWEVPKLSGVEAVIGLSFLEHFKMSLDFKQGYLVLESTTQ